MELRALPMGALAARNAVMLPLLLWSFFVLWLILALMPSYMLEVFFDIYLPPVYTPATAGAFALALLAFVLWQLRRWSRYRLDLRDAELVVQGESDLKVREATFPLANIEAVLFGQPLNRLEEFVDILRKAGVPKLQSVETKKFFKRGQMTIVGVDGSVAKFHFMDRPFDPVELRRFLTHLSQRVRVEIADLD